MGYTKGPTLAQNAPQIKDTHTRTHARTHTHTTKELKGNEE